MKHTIKLHILLVITALLLIPENPTSPWLDAINLNPTTPYGIDMVILWAETSLAIGVFALLITIITPAFSKFFLGYESKKPDEGSEVYFYVVMTLFVLSLFLAGERALQSTQRDREKDLSYVCDLLNENLEFSKSDGTKQEVDSICGTDPENPEPKKKPSRDTDE